MDSPETCRRILLHNRGTCKICPDCRIPLYLSKSHSENDRGIGSARVAFDTEAHTLNDDS